jgi:hypothetical protein
MSRSVEVVNAAQLCAFRGTRELGPSQPKTARLEMAPGRSFNAPRRVRAGDANGVPAERRRSANGVPAETVCTRRQTTAPRRCAGRRTAFRRETVHEEDDDVSAEMCRVGGRRSSGDAVQGEEPVRRHQT